MTITMSPKDFANTHHRLITKANRSILGQPNMVWTMIMAVLAGEHCLITGEPGTGKSWSVEVVAKLFFGRIRDFYGRAQGNIGMTSTVLLGGLIYNPATGELEPRKGVLLRYTVLQLDEINRMPPKTQAALLQALMEGSVEIDGVVYPVKLGFTAFATANKADQGTYELLKPLGDRFAFSALSKLPDAANRALIRSGQFVQLRDITPVFTDVDEYLEMVALVKQCAAAPTDETNNYITHVVDEFRKPESWFLIPRGQDGEYEPTIGIRTEMALLRGATVKALSHGRVAATPADVQYVLPTVLAHRLTIDPEKRNGGSVRSHIKDVLRDSGLYVPVKEV
jgi:MoxR-like ATPase